MYERRYFFKKIAVALLALVMSLCFFACDKDPEPEAEKEEPLVEMDWLYTKGTDIASDKGVVPLRGINAGGLFVHEEWMCPVYSKDTVTTISVLTERFGEERAQKLLKTYRSNWWTEQDFENVKALGYNMIRLPFAYFNVEKDGGYDFGEIDEFIRLCRRNSLYCILDLHGAYGSQNGKDHSGDTSQCELFDSAENMAKTTALWQAIAQRYKDEPTVAGYDLLNEPEGKNGNTEYAQWNYFDELYSAIRKIDDKHIIIIEGVWEANNLPGLLLYGWENVVYEFHNYCWGGDAEKQKKFVDDKIASYEKANFGCPIFIGEFNCFDELDAWHYTLSKFNEKGYSWAVWSYKVCAERSSWGNYVKDCERADVAFDSYEEIERKWSAGLSGFTESTWLTQVLRTYTNQ